MDVKSFTYYNFHIENFWNAPTKSINWTIYYHSEIVELNNYINNVENSEC